MVKRRGFERGDIVRVSFNPTVGREMQGDMRPALVLSPRDFNNTVGTALVAPITQGGNLARVAGFAVPLMGCGTETQGVVLVSAVRMLDLENRGARKVETAPASLTDEVLEILSSIIS
ncbi:MAG: type II toxin-antitoxin system ChpB family toxin [Gammaproteobacteria bacterium]|nr:type II toxin-antitoxin system ChpB family toxin [Gammaproteobacteria bacterium]MBU1723659.1 type II toxin-antitoxin system ChpB family toxin [Gammaproteobacteria bacterium]MBU2004743.1 type II toxin-antitoxin system ChpB family toxin [Gammaproteobacteria bacterium]